VADQVPVQATPEVTAEVLGFWGKAPTVPLELTIRAIRLLEMMVPPVVVEPPINTAGVAAADMTTPGLALFG